MNNSKTTVAATLLLIGGAGGFIGGVWVGQSTHPNQQQATVAGETDLTNSALLSDLANINKQCMLLRQSVEVKQSVAAGN